MDIEYLLLLQNFRNSIGGSLDTFMSMISKLSVGVIPVIFMCIVYWVFDKKAGNFFIFNFAGTSFVNGLIKLTACVYRPWIRDARVNSCGGCQGGCNGLFFTQRTYDMRDFSIRDRSNMAVEETPCDFNRVSRASCADYVFKKLPWCSHTAGCYCGFCDDSRGNMF